MARKKRGKRYRGHWCWCCGRIRANEKFSGKGHARHLCRDCARLGAEELAYRQAERNLERCLDWNGLIRRKQRAQFNRFLEHENPRVRAVAQKMLAEDTRLRAEWRETLQRESELEEEMYERESQALAQFQATQDESAAVDTAKTGSDWIEMPF